MMNGNCSFIVCNVTSPQFQHGDSRADEELKMKHETWIMMMR